MTRKRKTIAEVDVDTAHYVGNGTDGIYVAAAKGKDGWYVSSIVDSDTGHFVDAYITDDGPYPSEAEALTAGCYGAADWCIDNDVRHQRQLKRCLNAIKKAQS